MGCEGCDVNTNDSAHQSLIADVVRPAGKVVVFGIPKRHDKVYTVLVDNAKPDTLIPVIRQKIMPDGIVCTDSLSSYGKPDVSSLFITVSTIPRNLPTVKTTLTALKIFGIRQSASTQIQRNRSQINFGTPSRQLKILRDWREI